ncbi:MAG: glutaredoxin family protein [Brachybacterium tyrofermentans]
MDDLILTIYGTPTCGDCKLLVRHCQRKGVPYEYVDVTKDPEAAAHVKALGYVTGPVGEYGDDHWSGLRFDKVSALAKKQLTKAS